MRPVAHTVIDSIAAPMDQLFAVLSDAARVPQWLPGCTGVQSAAPFTKGVRFTARFGARATEFEIVDFSPPATFGWVERGGGGREGWKTFFHLERSGGLTAVTIRALWIPQSVFAWLRGHFFERRHVRRQLEAIVQNLRKLLQH